MQTKKTNDKTLKNFMREFFPYKQFKFLFHNINHNDHEAQAKRICDYFGYKSVYEYGAKECRAHLSFKRTLGISDMGYIVEVEPFVTEIESIYK